MPTLEDLYEGVKRRQNEAQASPITQDQFEAWLLEPVTRQFLLDLQAEYYQSLLNMPVGMTADEVAMESAKRTGEVRIMEQILEYIPTNLVEDGT